ncbi:unnamed protein product, partial [marine sediment metagenome]
ELSNDLNLNQNQLKNVAIENLVTAPVTPVIGQVYYNTTADRAYIWDGTSWVDITASAGSIPDFEGVYASDGDSTLTTANGDFTVNTGTGDFIVDSNDWQVDATGNVTANNINSNGNTFTLDADNAGAGADINIVAEQGSDSDGTLRYNSTTNRWEVSNDGGTFIEIATGTGDLDDAYDNDVDKILNVDNASGLELESTVTGNVIIDLQNTGDFVVQDAGVTFGTFTDTGEFQVDNLQMDANVISSTNLNGNISLSPDGNGVVNLNANTNIAGNTVILDSDNSGGDIALQFGTALGETITWDSVNSEFDLSDDLDIGQNQLKNVAIDNLAVAPVTPVIGQIYYNTVSSKTFIWNGTAWEDVIAEPHAASHTDGTDDIQLATNLQKGLMSATHVETLEDLEAQSDEINLNTVSTKLTLSENVVSSVAYLTYENPDDTFFVANIENTEYSINNNTSPGVALTGGTDASPVLNYVYVRESGATAF